jgi:GntR family transcriptional regulator
LSIDLHSPVPIYQQIAAHIRRSVAAGVYRPGEMIPSLRALALDLVVNPNTVKHAYDQLEREGIIHARKGLGMFVTKQAAETAQTQAIQAVYDSFAEGIRAGRSAKIPPEHLRSIFDLAIQEVEAPAKEQS